MREAKFIDPAKPVKPGLDYIGLRERGLTIIQELAGEIWTDYNEHDPGVTTLEQLCYALTELSYRAELPVEDLLAEPGTNRINLKRQGLVAPQAILPCNPLTENDYRKLIVDRVPVVANAWLPAYAPSEPGSVNGLYEIELYLPEAPPDAAGATVIEDVQRAYSSLRSLCEDVHAIHVLRPVTTTLAAKIAIDPVAVPERVLARILYGTGNFLAPELRRQPLDALMVEGKTPADLFSGPLLRHGFISDDQLQPRQDRFTLRDVTRVLLGTKGVTGVRDLIVATDDASMDASGRHTTLLVPRGGILRLDTGAAEKTSGIRLFRNDGECRLDPEVVQRELNRLWHDHRRTHDILSQCEHLLAFPKGTAVDVGEYYSIQHQFPAIYCVNARGLPHDASDARRAQARQFKAYLLVFEQLLADSCARLLCATRGASRGRFYQYLDTSVPDVAPSSPEDARTTRDWVLKRSYRAGLPPIVQGPDRALERRNRVLDVMLATYAETDGPLVLPPTSGSPGTDPAHSVVHARSKLELLRHLGRVGAGRGTGCDYLAPLSPENVSSLEFKTRLQLGMSASTPREFDALLKQLGVERIIDNAPVAHRESMMRHARHIEKKFKPVAHVAGGSEPGDGLPQPEMSEDLLIAAADAEHYRIGVLPIEGETEVTVVCRAPSQSLWQLAGKYADVKSALAGASVLLRTARAVDRHARRLYLVEHTLLRFGRSLASPADAGADFEHSFTMSAVICVPARQAGDPGYRESVCDIMRDNTPAHIVVHGRFLRLSRVAEFEQLYWNWRRALCSPHQSDVVESRCRDLRDFLRPDRP